MLARLLLIVVLMAASIFSVIKERQARHRSRVIEGMKQFGLALIEFDQEFGGYPSDRTAEDVKKGTGTDLPLTGEHVLNQLKAFGDGGSLGVIEEIGRADGGWTYFPGSNQCSNPAHPLLVSPPVDGKQMVLRIDNGIGVLGEGELDDLPEHICPPVTYPQGSGKR